jgi:hypothetical protein
MNTRNKIESIKDIFSIIAAICVAIWAVYSTWSQNEKRIADLKVVELEQKTTLRSHIVTNIQIQKLQSGKNSTILIAKVDLKNIGNQDVRVSLSNRTILISKVVFNKEGVDYKEPKYFGDSRYRGNTKLIGPFIDIGSNESYRLSYVTQINEQGTYLVRFLTKMNSTSIDELKDRKLGSSAFTYYSVGVDEFIYIE